MIERDSDGQSVEQLPKPKKKVNFEQKDFEKNLVDVKQTIKETEELIALSRQNKFSQDEIEEKPIKKGKNPFKKDEGL